MKASILIPHWMEGRITAVSVYNFLKHKGSHDVEIIVINNSFPHQSIEYLSPFESEIRIIENTDKTISSHGVALDMGIKNSDRDIFFCAESDSFPSKDGFLDEYDRLIKAGVDTAGSLLQLSGGRFLHPCGTAYNRSSWQDAKDYFENIPYNYYPNFMMRDNFPVHAMIHHSLVDEVSENPMDWVELSSNYKDNPKQTMKEKLEYYREIGLGVFHNGTGGRQESLKTYGARTEETDAPFIKVRATSSKIIGRLGYEPGQAFHYHMANAGRKIRYLSTETKWIHGREGQQQEYTINELGFVHLWGVSSYHKANIKGYEDVISFKEKQVTDLYNSLPSHLKI